MRAVIHDTHFDYEVTTEGDCWEKVGEGPDDYDERFAFRVATVTTDDHYSAYWRPVLKPEAERREGEGNRKTYPTDVEALRAGVSYVLDNLPNLKHYL